MLQLILLVSSTLADPLPPQWPNVFWQNFSERVSSDQKVFHDTRGSYLYNYTLGGYKIYRENGRYDGICTGGGPYDNQNTACSNIVSKGIRYLYFDDHNDCYYCCNSTTGCGVLKPTWISPATYIDTEVHNGVLTYKWLYVANKKEFFYETTEKEPTDRVTVSLYEEPGEYFDYGPRLKNCVVSQLAVPSKCVNAPPATWGGCPTLRGEYIQTSDS